MLIKIRRQDTFDKYPNFPWCDPNKDEYFFPKIYRSYILTLASKSIKGHVKALSLGLSNLTQSLSIDNLIFLGDMETPWLYQHSNYLPVKEALEFLQANKVNRKFNGALQVQAKELSVFLKHLFWLTRCNASLPIFHFMDSEENIVGSLCQYGNVHLSTLNKDTDKQFRQSIQRSDFEFLKGSTCHEPFSKTSTIKHRQIVV